MVTWRRASARRRKALVLSINPYRKTHVFRYECAHSFVILHSTFVITHTVAPRTNCGIRRSAFGGSLPVSASCSAALETLRANCAELAA
jgi:hypothetical protein